MRLSERSSRILRRVETAAVGSPLADAHGFGALASELPTFEYPALVQFDCS